MKQVRTIGIWIIEARKESDSLPRQWLPGIPNRGIEQTFLIVSDTFPDNEILKEVLTRHKFAPGDVTGIRKMDGVAHLWDWIAPAVGSTNLNGRTEDDASE